MKINCLKFIEEVRKNTDLTERKKLTVIQVGNEPASTLYVNSKKKEAEKWNIECNVVNMPEDSTTEDVIIKICLNTDSDGIIVQLPLPKHINQQEVIDAIPQHLNVDGFKQTGKETLYEPCTPYNFGKLFSGENPNVYPCTPKGIIMLLESMTELEGKLVTLIGRGKTVGEPLRDMLLKKNCTLAVCHSKSSRFNTYRLCRLSDIVISAVGEPNLFNHEWLKVSFINPIIVIDAGISRVNGKQVGDFSHKVKDYRLDLDFSDRIQYTPWTNGVGKLTVMALMLNVREEK